MLPIGLAAIIFGGWIFAVVATVVLGLATWEFWRLFRQGGYAPSAPILIGAVVLIALARYAGGFRWADLLLAVSVLASMGWHLYTFEHGLPTGAVDFAIDLGGILYLGWVGSYLISLRDMEQGLWLMLLVLPAVWIADSGAYFIGRKIGKHKMAPHLSPGKSWEGYAGGILVSIPLTGLLAVLWSRWDPALAFWQGAVVGLIMASITPLGDLGESMLKRQFKVKDSSNLIPGHGGIMDRIDSWVWAAAIGYYLFSWFL